MVKDYLLAPMTHFVRRNILTVLLRFKNEKRIITQQAGAFCLIMLFLPMTWCLDISWVSNGKSLPLSKSVTCNALTTTLLAPQMFALCSRKYRDSLANLCAAVQRSDGRYRIVVHMLIRITACYFRHTTGC